MIDPNVQLCVDRLVAPLSSRIENHRTPTNENNPVATEPVHVVNCNEKKTGSLVQSEKNFLTAIRARSFVDSAREFGFSLDKSLLGKTSSFLVRNPSNSSERFSAISLKPLGLTKRCRCAEPIDFRSMLALNYSRPSSMSRNFFIPNLKTK